MKIIRILTAVGETCVPRTTGRLAFRLFCRTANPNRLSAGEKRANERAAAVMADARRHRLTTTGGWVMAYEFRPDVYSPGSPVALVIPGWRSRTEHMTGLILAARELGYRVICVDLPGHGRSSGRILNMANAVEAVKAVETWFGPIDTIIGHSFGGAVGCNAAFGSVARFAAIPVRRLVLISTPNSMPAFFRWFGGQIGLGPRSQAAMEAVVADLAGNPLDIFVNEDQLRALKVPTLLVHAPDDRQVDFASSEAMARAGDHVSLVEAGGLGHSRIISDAGVLAQVASFLHQPPRRLAA